MTSLHLMIDQLPSDNNQDLIKNIFQKINQHMVTDLHQLITNLVLTRYLTLKTSLLMEVDQHLLNINLVLTLNLKLRASQELIKSHKVSTKTNQLMLNQQEELSSLQRMLIKNLSQAQLLLKKVIALKMQLVLITSPEQLTL